MIAKDEEEDAKIIGYFSKQLRQTKEYEFLVYSLHPLIETLKKSEYAKQLLKPYSLIMKNRFEIGAKRMKLFKEDAKAQGKDEVVVLRKAFVYLGLFESTVTNLIDLIIMIYVANHHDFFVYNSREYARKLGDLDNAMLSEKLRFLNQHALKIFSRNLNKDLRNKIAHLDFEINNDGTVSVDKQKFYIETEILKLSAFILVVSEALKTCDVSTLLQESMKE